MAKILTLVIPTYNMEKYLDRCLTSVIVDDKKTLEQLEVLIIIDGAKDHSSEIAHKYQERFPQVFKVIDKENGNYGSCVNRGVLEASGKYIKILDADDWFDTAAFEVYLKKLNLVDSDVVLTNYQRVLDDETVVKRAVYGYKDFEQLTSERFSSIIEIEMHAITYRRQTLIDMGYRQTEGISYTDTEWVMLPMVYAQKVTFVDEMLYQYLVGRDGQTMDPAVLVKAYPQMLVVYKSIIEHYSKLQSLGIASAYLKDKLFRGLLDVYVLELVRDRNNHCEKLIEFDNFLEDADKELFASLAEASIDKHVPYKIVADWRRRKHAGISRLGCMSFLLIRTLKDWIKRYLMCKS